MAAISIVQDSPQGRALQEAVQECGIFHSQKRRYCPADAGTDLRIPIVRSAPWRSRIATLQASIRPHELCSLNAVHWDALSVHNLAYTTPSPTDSCSATEVMNADLSRGLCMQLYTFMRDHELPMYDNDVLGLQAGLEL